MFSVLILSTHLITRGFIQDTETDCDCMWSDGGSVDVFFALVNWQIKSYAEQMFRQKIRYLQLGKATKRLGQAELKAGHK